MYIEHHEVLKLSLKDQFLAISLDHWTDVASRSFIGVTAQWIDKQFDIYYAVLDFCEDSNHSAFWASGTVMDILYSFQCPKDNIIGAIGDNTASMVATLQELSRDYTNCFAHGCFAHLLQRAIYASLKDSPILDLLNEAKHIVSFIHSSPKFLTLLKSVELDSNMLPGKKITGHKPTPPGSTRWDGLQIMLGSLLDQITHINRALHEYQLLNPTNSSIPNEFSPQFQQHKISIYETLSVLRSVTVQSQNREAHIGFVIPFYYYINNYCTELNNSGSFQDLKNFGNTLKLEFNKRIDKLYFCNSVPSLSSSRYWKPQYIIASLLAPNTRYPLAQMHDWFRFCNIFKTNVILPNSDLVIPQVPSRGLISLQSIFDGILTPNTPRSTIGNLYSQSDEVTRFLNLVTTDKTQPGLLWWKEYSDTFPELSKVARKILAIPIDSAEAERLFSTTGGIITVDRPNLSEETARESTLLKYNVVIPKFRKP